MDNLVYLYLSEMGQTPKLNAAEEKDLGSRIEQGKYLAKLDQDVNQIGHKPAASALVRELINIFCKQRYSRRGNQTV